MKNFLKLFALFACSALVFVACETDETVDDYTVEVTKISDYKVLPGSEKIQVTWTVPDDKDITGAKIVWTGSSEGEHSIGEDDGFAINTDQEYIIPDLNDGGVYSVTIYSLVGAYLGTGSAIEAGVKVYGPETYAEAAQPEVDGGTVTMGETDATVTWTNIDFSEGAYGVDVKYLNNDGIYDYEKTIFTGTDGQTTTLTNPKPGESFTYMALYKPNSQSYDFDNNTHDEGYDYAEVEGKATVTIANTDLTNATPVIESAVGGNEKLTVKWSGITDKVLSADITLYKYDADSGEYIKDITFGTEGTTNVLASAFEKVLVQDAETQDERYVVTYEIENLTSGTNYKVGIKNNIESYSTSEVPTSNIFVYGDDLYKYQPMIAVPTDESVSMVHEMYSSDTANITITWDMTGVVISDIEYILVTYTDNEDNTCADVEVQVSSVDGVHTSILSDGNYGFKSNSTISYKTYFRPSGGADLVEGDKVEYYNDNSGDGSITIPYPALVVPENLSLQAGYTGDNEYLRLSWDDIGLLAYEAGIELNISYGTETQAGNNNLSSMDVSLDNDASNDDIESTTVTVGEPGPEQQEYNYCWVDISESIDSDVTYVAYVTVSAAKSATTEASDTYTATTYSPESYAELAELLGSSDRASVKYPDEDGNATISWDWRSATADAKAVEITNYTESDGGGVGTVEKTYRTGVDMTTTLLDPRGATDVTYLAYFQPDNGIDEVYIEKTLTLPGIEITEPTLWLTTDTDLTININYGVESLYNLTGLKIYWRVQDTEEPNAYTCIPISGDDFKVGEFSQTLTAASNSIVVDEIYEVYITVGDEDGNTDRAVAVATADEPLTIRTYNADSYKSEKSPVVPTHTAATTGESRLFIWDWTMNEDVRGVIINYFDATGAPATAGQMDYEGELPESISIPINQTTSTYTYTLYYYPTGGLTPVAGTPSGTLEYAEQAPPVPQMVAVTSSFDESDKATFKVEFSIADYNRGYIEDNEVNVFCVDDSTGAEVIETVELVDGQTAYEVTVSDGLNAGSTYDINVGIVAKEGYYYGADAEQYSEVTVADVKAYNKASYYNYIPSVTAEADYTGKISFVWSDYGSTELVSVSLTYGSYTSDDIVPTALNNDLNSIDYNTLIDSFTYASNFVLTQSTNAMLTYEILEFTVVSQPTLINAKYYDIITLEGVYRIYTAKGLAAFADIVNGIGDDDDYDDDDVVTDGDATFSWTQNSAAKGTLVANLDLSDLDGETTKNSWTSIGTATYKYAGTFDGGGYIIDNLYTSAAAQYFGLFGYVTTGAVINNVKLTNVDITAGDTNVAALVGYSYGTYAGSSDYTVYQANAANIMNCEVSGEIKGNSKANISSIIGCGNNMVLIENTKNYANISGVSGSSGAFIGGFGGNGTPVWIENCENHGDVTATGSGGTIGGFGGYWNINGVSRIIDCTNYGDITAGGIEAAGFIGSHANGGTFVRCNNEGTITATTTNAGGIFGKSTAATVYACSNSGNISGTDYVAGIIGEYSGSSTINGSDSEYDSGSITSSYNKGQISGTGDNVGGIIGSNKGTLSYYDNYGMVLLSGATEHSSDNGIYGATTGAVTNCNDYAFDPSESDVVLVSDTYQIYTAKGLKAFANLVDGSTNSTSAVVYDAATGTSITFTEVAIPTAKAKLMADIDLSELSTTNNWSPVATTFEGTFNGAGYSIENLHISNDNSNVALFETLGAGTIQNVTINNPSITTTGSNVGAVVGTMSGEGTVEYCYVTGSTAAVAGANNVGGVVGTQSAGTISNVENAAAVSGSGDNVGGIVGYVAGAVEGIGGGVVSKVSNTGTVTATGNNAGGIAGYSAGTITGNISPISTNSGEVTANENAGGIVGTNDGTLSYFENSAEVFVTGEGSVNIDGVVGTGSGTESNCSSTFISMPDDVDIAYINSVYQIYTDKGLKAFADIVNQTFTTLDDLSSAGIDAYQSSTDADGILMANIDMTDITWSPIGNTESRAYTGEFSGNTYTISNLKISTAAQYAGLFGYVDGAVIDDVVLKDVNMTSTKGYLAGIAGYANASTITNCEVASGTISSPSEGRIAGIVGCAVEGVTLTNNINRAAVTVGSNGAGIVGYATGVIVVENCHNYGSITASSGTVGGIGGWMNMSSGSSVTECTNSGAISSEGDYAGGILGNTGTTYENGVVEDCTNSGSVTNTAAYTGGIIGRTNGTTSITINTSSNSGDITGTTHVGGIAGYVYTNSVISGTDTDNRSSNTGIITGTDATSLGGLVGELATGATLSYYNNYGLVQIGEEEKNSSCGLVGTSSAGTVTEDTCADFYFDASDVDLVDITGVYHIYTPKGLVAFADLVNGNDNTLDANTYVFDGGGEITFSGTAVADADALLVADIDLSGYTDWADYAMEDYAGTFDGGNGLSATNSIETGIEITGLTGTSGFFKSTATGAEINNLTIKDAEITSSGANVGVLIGTAGVTGTAIGTISYCRLHGEITGNGTSTAGVVGSTNVLLIEYTDNYVNVTADEQTHAAGFVGARSAGTLTLDYCNNYGTITAKSGAGISGYLGAAHTFTGCNNYGLIDTTSESGGIINSSVAGTYIMCANYGVIKCTGTPVGGIIGNAWGATITVTACNNYAAITGSTIVGGIVGSINNTININGAYADNSITESYNYGAVNSSVTSAANVGGIVGYLKSGSTVSNYVNKANVTYGGTLSTVGYGSISGGTSVNTTESTGDNNDSTLMGVIGNNAGAENSVTDCSDTFAGLPASLASFTAVAGDEEVSIVFNWTFGADVETVAGVKIFYATTDLGVYTTKLISGDVTASGSGTHTLTESADGLLEGTSYSVYVEACNADGITSGGATATTVTTMKEMPSADEVEDPDIVVRGVTYEISTPKGLVAFAQIVNGTLESTDDINTNFDEDESFWSNSAASGKLVENINMEGVEWTPIGLAASSNTAAYTAGVIESTFTGTFDGDVYTISNLTISKTETTAEKDTGTDNYNQALFGYISAATIKNVTLENVNISVCAYFRHTGAVVGHAVSGSTIDNCKVSSGSITGTTQPTGGIAGYVAAGTVTNCTNYASVSGVNGTAGIIGQVQGIVVTSCKNYGEITCSGYSGALIGQVDTSYANIDDCHNYGDVTGSSINVGGMVGYYNAKALNSSSTDTDAATSNYLTNCSNSGSIYSTGDCVAGLVGSFRPQTSGYTYVKGCSNSGAIESTTSYVGGLLGDANTILEIADDDSYYTIYDSSNSGSVTGKNYVGGIAGRINAAAKVSGVSTSSRSTNSGMISGTTYVGGIIGYLTAESALSFYNNNGVVILDGVQANGLSSNGIVGNYSDVSGCIANCTDNKTNQTVAPALSSVEVKENSEVVEIEVSWTFSSTAAVSGVKIYYGTTTSGYSSYSIPGSSTYSYKLTAADGLLEGTEYSIYAVTYNSIYIETEDSSFAGGSSDNLLKAETITYDIAYNSDGTYEIFSETGMIAFKDLVEGSENTAGAKINGFTWPVAVVDAGGDGDGDGGDGEVSVVGMTKAETTTINGQVMNNITLTETWSAIVDFDGTFDGGNGGSVDGSGIAITGLSGEQGLFASTLSGAVVKNITLKDVKISTTSDTVGAVVGSAVGTSISYCYVAGYVTANSIVGGIVGVIDTDSSVSYAYNDALVSATATGGVAGGIVGTNDGGEVTYSTNNSTVSIDGSDHMDANALVGSGTAADDNTCEDLYATDIEFAEDKYYIYSANGLIAFADLVNGNVNSSNARTKGTGFASFEGTHTDIVGVVTTTINMYGKTWSGMVDYAGTFDGGNGGAGVATNIEIQNLTSTNGLFVSLASGASVSNVTLATPAISNSDEGASVGAIAGTTVAGSAIAYCVVTDGSVTVSGTGAVAGALVGTNEGAITNSTTSCTVTVGGVLQNGQSDSMFVGAGEGTVDANSSDDYDGGTAIPAAAVSGVTAYPTYTDDASSIVVSWTFGESVAKIVKVIVYYKAVDGDGNWSSETITDNITTDTTDSKTLTGEDVDADTDYEIYVVTANFDGALTASNATESEPIEVTTYNNASYDSDVPAIISAIVVEDATKNVVVTWNEDTFTSADLVKVTVTYGTGADKDKVFTATEIATANYTSTFAYETDVNSFTYTATFKPVEYMASGSEYDGDLVAENTDVPYVTAPSTGDGYVTATIAASDLVEVEDDKYEIYSATGLMEFADLVNKGSTAIDGTVMNTIDLTGEIWTPMVDYAGTFDGGNGGAEATGVEIRNLAGGNGLFASTDEATIKNVTLISVAISGGDSNIGGIVGAAVDTDIEYVSVSGSVSGASIVGGIAGSVDSDSTIANATNSASVTATSATAGALVGSNASTAITNSTNTGSVTIDELPYNNDTDSWLVGSGTAADATCLDKYTDGDAATLTTALEITAVPNYEEGTESIKVSWGNALNTYANVVSAKLFYKESEGGTYVGVTIAELTSSWSSPTITLEAGKTYTFYVETYNYVGAGTVSNEATAKAYDEDTYDSETLPTLTASYNGNSKAITVEWDASSLSDELQKIEVTYDGSTETISDLTAGIYEMTATYDSETELSYSCYYAPMAASQSWIEVEATDDVTITEAPTDIILSNGVYQIYTAKGLMTFADLVNGTDSGYDAITEGDNFPTLGGDALTTISGTVMADINLSNYTWVAMDDYAGTFDGGNGGADAATMNADEIFEITGLTGSQGLFASAGGGATIKNVTITVNITATASNTAALVGVNVNIGDIGDITITYCNVSGSIGGSQACTGSMVGNMNINATLTITNSNNYAKITASGNSGGFVGQIGDTGRTLILSNCENHGNVSAATTGGFGGWWRVSTTSVVSNCVNYGDITGSSNTGGIVANISNNGSIYNCFNTGAISGGGGNAGGIAGNLAASVVLDGLYDGATVNSYNSGTISGTSANVGGIVGVNAGSISNYYNYGAVLPSSGATHETANAIIGSGTAGTSCEDKYGEEAPEIGGDTDDTTSAGGDIVDLEDGDDFTNTEYAGDGGAGVVDLEDGDDFTNTDYPGDGKTDLIDVVDGDDITNATN